MKELRIHSNEYQPKSQLLEVTSLWLKLVVDRSELFLIFQSYLLIKDICSPSIIASHIIIGHCPA